MADSGGVGSAAPGLTVGLAAVVIQMGVVVALGRVVKFDENHGFGFISPEGGGEDVFLHVNDLSFPEAQLRVGILVEFDEVRGDRGPKASSVRIPRGTPPLRDLAERRLRPANADRSFLTGASNAAGAEQAPIRSGEDDLCDVLSSEEFEAEVLRILLTQCGSLTGEQIVAVLRAMTEVAFRHKWVDAE